METPTPFRNTMTMTCPLCHVMLQPMSRQGIEIDFCPQCRGVWLDRGELDKIIERESRLLEGDSRRDYRRDARPEDDDDDRENFGRRKKRRGFLGDLLDFD